MAAASINGHYSKGHHNLNQRSWSPVLISRLDAVTCPAIIPMKIRTSLCMTHLLQPRSRNDANDCIGDHL